MSLIKNKTIVIFFACAFAILFTQYTIIYTVPEGYTALQSNRLDKNFPSPLIGPGLHYKLPFVESIPIDLRLQSFSSQKSTFISEDSQVLLIDYYATWRVTNPIIYYLHAHNNIQQMQQQLTQEINPLLRMELAQQKLQAILSHAQQTDLLHKVLLHINQQSKTYGITVMDIGVKSIDFSSETNEAILENTRSEQIHAALKQRILGQTHAATIQQDADNQAALLLAQATEEAAIIRSEADAKAAKISNAAYRKNPQFASFYLYLETLRKGFLQHAIGIEQTHNRRSVGKTPRA